MEPETLVILLDADVLLIDLRYPNDVRFGTNRRVLDRLRTEGFAVGITAQALLEIVGVLSFNVAASRIVPWADLICVQYGLGVVPDPQSHPDFAGCTFREIVSRMSSRMALGDAVQAIQIERHTPTADCLLSWNAKHFADKLAVPVQTPADWLGQRVAAHP